MDQIPFSVCAIRRFICIGKCLGVRACHADFVAADAYICLVTLFFYELFLDGVGSRFIQIVMIADKISRFLCIMSSLQFLNDFIVDLGHCVLPPHMICLKLYFLKYKPLSYFC